jgi:hypothetical protein
VTKLVVKFDRAMRKGSYQVMKTNDALWPKMDRVYYDESGTLFTMEVKLEPGHEYEFTLNTSSGGSFASAEGTALAMVRISFHTRQ